MLDPEIKAQIIGKSYTELPLEIQQTLASELRPSGGFTDQQRSLFQGMYLEVDDLVALESLNSQSPMFQIGAIEHEGSFYIPADLLTDCRAEETYGHARDWLMSLKIVYIDPALLEVL